MPNYIHNRRETQHTGATLVGDGSTAIINMLLFHCRVDFRRQNLTSIDIRFWRPVGPRTDRVKVMLGMIL